MKKIKNYILLVDSHRRPSRQRNTAGRYRVGAKSPKEAIKLLREKIKFGSIQVYYESEQVYYETNRKTVGYKEVFREHLYSDESGKIIQELLPVRSAIAPINK